MSLPDEQQSARAVKIAAVTVVDKTRLLNPHGAEDYAEAISSAAGESEDKARAREL